MRIPQFTSRRTRMRRMSRIHPGSDTTKNFSYIRTLLHVRIAIIFIITLHVEVSVKSYQLVHYTRQLYDTRKFLHTER